MTEPANGAAVDWQKAGDEALEHFRKLIRFNTVNPPGDELAAAKYLAGVLEAEGLEPTIVESAPGRGNMVCRIEGDGSKKPLLLTGHLDVVEADAEKWKHDPFAAEIDGGYLYGRGAVDMKNMVAMSLMVQLLVRRSGVKPKRDLIFAAVAGEETGGEFGSRFLVEKHPELVRAEYMLGEIGGFTQNINGAKIYPVQVAEKGICWVKVSVEGDPGHGSMPHKNNAVVKLAQGIAKLGRKRLPHHATEVVEKFVRTVAATQKFPASTALPMLLNPVTCNFVIDNFLPPDRRATFDAILHNTANPTILKAGSKTNVIPSRAEAQIDGRLLPGESSSSFVSEIKDLLGPQFEVEVLQSQPATSSSSDTELFRHLERMLKRHEPDATVVPTMIPGFTDATHFSKLGMNCYGFAPIKFPMDADYTFTELFHGHNERIPVEGFKWGLRVLYEAVSEFVAE